jgi:hypothetical protein
MLRRGTLLYGYGLRKAKKISLKVTRFAAQNVPKKYHQSSVSPKMYGVPEH